jgi:hypothetical protein
MPRLVRAVRLARGHQQVQVVQQVRAVPVALQVRPVRLVRAVRLVLMARPVLMDLAHLKPQGSLGLRSFGPWLFAYRRRH